MEVDLVGGLGNQLFCLAGGVALSGVQQRPVTLRLQLPPREFASSSILELDLGWLRGLDNVRLQTSRQGLLHNRLSAATSRIGGLRRRRSSGQYFQDWRIVDTAHLFGFPLTLVPRVPPPREHLARVQGSVGIHVRLGDYVNHATIRNLNLDFYREAILRLDPSLRAGPFTLFSDNLTGAMNLLKPLKIEIGPAGTSLSSAAQDLWLMAQTKGLIMANSTYSWWAAHEISNAGGQVVAPCVWAKDPDNPFGRNLVRPDWIAS